jgi:hypothetical protein
MRPVLSRSRIAVLAVGLLAPVAIAVAPAASAACAAPGTRSISGTVFGVDNRDVNVSIGFDVQSTSGTIINVSDGCPKTGGYSAPVKEYNHYVKYTGQGQNTMQYDNKGVAKGNTVRTWSLTNLPSNAKSVFIEVYARDYATYNNPSAMGPVNTAKYGFARRVQVAVGSTNVVIRLPMNCNYKGGNNAAIAGAVRTSAGTAVKPDFVYAFSDLPDGNYKIMGWGIATTSTGNYKVNALAANEAYHLQLSYRGRTYVKRGINVTTCSTVGVNWVVAG